MQNFRELEAQQITANQELYLEHGCETREEYLEYLSEEYGIDIDTVKSLADMLGPTEDFDGLVTSLQDASDDWF